MLATTFSSPLWQLWQGRSRLGNKRTDGRIWWKLRSLYLLHLRRTNCHSPSPSSSPEGPTNRLTKKVSYYLPGYLPGYLPYLLPTSFLYSLTHTSLSPTVSLFSTRSLYFYCFLLRTVSSLAFRLHYNPGFAISTALSLSFFLYTEGFGGFLKIPRQIHPAATDAVIIARQSIFFWAQAPTATRKLDSRFPKA